MHSQGLSTPPSTPSNQPLLSPFSLGEWASSTGYSFHPPSDWSLVPSLPGFFTAQDIRDGPTRSSPSVSPSIPSSDIASPDTPSHSPSPRSRRSPDYIRRPCNAFMIFRSNFLKSQTIPADVERRQQSLSKIAGEVWRMLPEAEKDEYRCKAREEQKKHAQMYPGYKFTPTPRRSGHSRSCRDAPHAKASPENSDEERIRMLRETYTHVAGPAPPPTRRRRKPAPKVKIEDEERMVFMPQPSADASHNMLSVAQLRAPGSIYSVPQLPAQFPPTMPHYTYLPRRPSTSLGFNESSDQQSNPLINMGGTGESGQSKIMEPKLNFGFPRTYGISMSLPASPAASPDVQPKQERLIDDAGLLDISMCFGDEFKEALFFPSPSVNTGFSSDNSSFDLAPQYYDPQLFSFLANPLGNSDTKGASSSGQQ